MRVQLFKLVLLLGALALATFAPAARALGTSELIDVVIQAVEPQLAPAKPLVLCLLAGTSLQGVLTASQPRVMQDVSVSGGALLAKRPEDWNGHF